MNIVLVEDESLTALFISEILEDLGHTVIASYDSAKPLLDAIDPEAIDLVLMDIEINGEMDGIECAGILKSRYDIPSVFLTSYQDTYTMKDAMQASPLAYIIKPVSAPEVEAILLVAENSLKGVIRKDDDLLTLGEYTYSVSTNTLKDSEGTIKLSKNESIAVKLLFKNRGNIVDIDTMIDTIWSDKSNRESSLRELVYRLRKKIPNIKITSLSKVGYSIE